MGVIRKINSLRPLLSVHALFRTIWVNFRWLPVRQAVYLPIWVNRLHSFNMGGEYLSNANTLSRG